MKDFLTQCLEGSARLEQLDDFIKVWHNTPNNQVVLGSLNDYLGISSKEAHHWLCSGSKVFQEFLETRKEQRKLSHEVNAPQSCPIVKAQEQIHVALEEVAEELFCDLPVDAYSHFNQIRKKYDEV